MRKNVAWLTQLTNQSLSVEHTLFSSGYGVTKLSQPLFMYVCMCMYVCMYEHYVHMLYGTMYTKMRGVTKLLPLFPSRPTTSCV